MNKLTILMITLNEEFHIEECIKSIADIADEIIILDSFSNDKTVEIAESLGAKVIQRKFQLKLSWCCFERLRLLYMAKYSKPTNATEI